MAGLVKDGATGATPLEEMVSQLAQPRTTWLMVPAAVVDQALDDLVSLLDAGDVVIEGGNSHYRDDMRRGTQLQTRGIHYLDARNERWVRRAGLPVPRTSTRFTPRA